MGHLSNIFEAIRWCSEDSFEPFVDEYFTATAAAPGTEEKIEVLRRRNELGHPLWHPNDRVEYSGLSLESNLSNLRPPKQLE